MAEKAQTLFTWEEIKLELAQRIVAIHVRMDTAEGDGLIRLQGGVQELKRLMNLPQSLLVRREQVDETKGSSPPALR